MISAIFRVMEEVVGFESDHISEINER